MSKIEQAGPAPEVAVKHVREQRALRSIVTYVQEYKPQTAPELVAQLGVIKEIALEGLGI